MDGKNSAAHFLKLVIASCCCCCWPVILALISFFHFLKLICLFLLQNCELCISFIYCCCVCNLQLATEHTCCTCCSTTARRKRRRRKSENKSILFFNISQCTVNFFSLLFAQVRWRWIWSSWWLCRCCCYCCPELVLALAVLAVSRVFAPNFERIENSLSRIRNTESERERN